MTRETREGGEGEERGKQIRLPREESLILSREAAPSLQTSQILEATNQQFLHVGNPSLPQFLLQGAKAVNFLPLLTHVIFQVKQKPFHEVNTEQLLSD